MLADRVDVDFAELTENPQEERCFWTQEPVRVRSELPIILN